MSKTFDNDKIEQLVTECEHLRRVGSAGHLGDDLPQIHDRLLTTRASMDRVEEIVVQLMRVKEVTRRNVKVSKAAVEDRWDEEARKTKVGFAHGDAAPRERYARYNLSTVRETTALRQAEREDDQISTALEIARWCHTGLDGVRWVLNNRIRLLTIDTTLER